MTFDDTIIEDTYKPLGMLVAFVPVKLFAGLNEQPGIYDSYHEIYQVPEEMRRTEYAQEATSESVDAEPAVTGNAAASLPARC